MTDSKSVAPAERAPLRGEERFRGIDADVTEFWRFALSDLRMNNARGYLAEFLVARALGVDAVRVEWDDFDVLWGSVKIEVKSSAYVQAWPQSKPSRISFGGLRSRAWTSEGGRASNASYKADVYVFAWQTTIDPELYDPLDIDAWSFHVLARSRLEQLGVGSIALSRLARMSDPVDFDGLRTAIHGIVSPSVS